MNEFESHSDKTSMPQTHEEFTKQMDDSIDSLDDEKESTVFASGCSALLFIVILIFLIVGAVKIFWGLNVTSKSLPNRVEFILSISK